MIFLTNKGGHASSVRRALLKCTDSGGNETVLDVRLTRPDGSDFESLNVQPGERVKSRAKFTVPFGYTLGGKTVTLHLEPVLAPAVQLRHDFGQFHGT